MRRTPRQSSSVSDSFDLTPASPSDYARIIAARHVSISSVARGAGIGLLFATVSATAANIIVNSAEDSLTSSDGNCTLREAVANANAGADTTGGDCVAGVAGLDTVDLTGVAGIITLASGEIAITQPLTITGPGPDVLTIDANNASRIFGTQAPGSTLAISGLTLTRGQTTSDFIGQGGAVNAYSSSLTLDSVVVSNSSTTGNQSVGGGVYAGGTFSMTNSTVTGSSTAGIGAFGGGIFVRGGSASLTNSTVSGNSTSGSSAQGGGIHVQGNSVTLTNSTVSGNSTSNTGAHGGGIATSLADANVITVNSTVSNNTTTGTNAQSGGIHSSSHVSLTNSTVAFNASTAGVDGVSAFQDEVGQPINLSVVNTIIAQSGAGEVACSGSANSGNNSLVTDESCGTASLIGGAATSVAALSLGPLQVNGGPTTTHALGAGSVAIGGGSGGVCFAPPVNGRDQRGVSRQACDVGAFETAELDLGDAPDASPQVIPTQSYPTLLANNGAAHLINSDSPYLGATPPDADADGQPDATATGDGADEDGLSPTVFPIGETTTVTVTVTNGVEIDRGFGNVWIDFNGDGDWDDANEHVAIEVDTFPGTFTFDVTIPPGTPSGTLFARGRICNQEDECNTPRGIAGSGEVEDYALTIGSGGAGFSGGGGGGGCKKILGVVCVGATDSWLLGLFAGLGLWRRFGRRRA